MPYKMKEHDGKHCIEKEDGELVKGSCHADKAETEKMMRAMMANENMSAHLLDEFVGVRLGEPYRLFPFGRIVKNGKAREITPEIAKAFKLPHFKPAIKLGSHDDPTPAGGFIVGLEVRPDGLYAVPEWNDKGAEAIRDGAYRYHSPEVIWADGALEDPTTGDAINGPLVLGDALLHMPHLGEATALYSVTQGVNMEENVTVPKSFWDSFVAPLFGKKAEPERVEVIPADYEAAKRERDEYKAAIEKRDAELARKARIEKFDAELKDTKADPTLAELLADLPDEKAELVMRQFKALSEQINESALTAEAGTEGAPIDDPKAAFNAAVLALAAEKKLTYNAAFEQAKATHADLFKSAFAK